MIETENTTDLRGSIARRAYELYLHRGGHPGREFDDWLEAEREVLSASSPEAATAAAEAPPAPKPARPRAAKTPAATTTPRKRTRKQED
jgi:hypothetical protein